MTIEHHLIPNPKDNRRVIGNPTKRHFENARKKESEAIRKESYMERPKDEIEKEIETVKAIRSGKVRRDILDYLYKKMGDNEFAVWMHNMRNPEKELTGPEQELVKMSDSAIQKIRNKFGLVKQKSLLEVVRFIKSEHFHMMAMLGGTGGSYEPHNDLVYMRSSRNKELTPEQFLFLTLHENIHRGGFHSFRKNKREVLFADRVGLSFRILEKKKILGTFLNEGMTQLIANEEYLKIVQSNPSLKKSYEKVIASEDDFDRKNAVEVIRRMINFSAHEGDTSKPYAYKENVEVLLELMKEISIKNSERFPETKDVYEFFKEAYFKHPTLLPLLKLIKSTIGEVRFKQLIEKE